MVIIREIMYCKPGKVRPLVEKFMTMKKIMAKNGLATMRVMTDLSTDRYWTLVAEMEVASLTEFEKTMAPGSMSDADAKEFETVMQGYHDLVESGRREIYKLEG